jgi:hypothetical protein
VPSARPIATSPSTSTARAPPSRPTWPPDRDGPALANPDPRRPPQWGLPGLRNAQPPVDAAAPGGDADAAATSPGSEGARTARQTQATSWPKAEPTIAASGARASPDTRAAVKVEPTSRDRHPTGAEKTAPRADPPAPTSPARRAGPGHARGARVAIDVVSLNSDKTCQLNFYTFEPLRRHIARLAFELQQDGLKTSQSELFNAPLALGRRRRRTQPAARIPQPDGRPALTQGCGGDAAQPRSTTGSPG